MLPAARPFLGCVSALAVLGLFVALSSAPPGEMWTVLIRHGGFLVLALLAFFLGMRIPAIVIRQQAKLVTIVVWLLLSLMLITDIGHSAKGATRWLQLGPLTIQPSLFLQVLWPILLASWVAKDPLRVKAASNITVLLLWFLLLMMPVLWQPDIGSVAILAVVSAYVLGVAGLPGSILVRFLPIFFVFALLVLYLFPHVYDRLNTFQSQENYQVSRAQEAFANGGWTGVGPGNGVLKYGHIPESTTDFVLALIAEEWGILGCCLVWGLFIAITFLGMKLARECKHTYGVLLMSGATVVISFQAAYNMAMILGTVPVKGLPLPFVSRGGSSLLALSLLLGIAVNATRSQLRRKPGKFTPTIS